jgi:hypothetical protein
MARSRLTKGARRRPEGYAATIVLLCGLAAPARGDDGLHGRLELQDMGSFARADTLDAALDASERNDVSGNFRLTWEPSWGPWSISVHYLLDGVYGDSERLAREEGTLIPEPPGTWFDLTNTFAGRGALTASQTIDRLCVGYATPDFVLRIGRQALSWGSGMVFRPMDLFDPFSPTAIDTEYKPGTDMAYAQVLFGDGSDLQLIAVPRAARSGGAPTTNASSFAAHFHTVFFNHQTTLLLARDHGDWVMGLGVNGTWGGATWNIELVPTLIDHGPARFSGLANISDAVTLFDRNATVFAEYFHNGFGVSDARFSLASLPPDLLDRLGRGQIFNTRRDHLAGGMTLEVTPLFNLSPTVLASLDDGSLYAILATTYSLSDNLTLVAGAQAPLGPKDSEFGGMPLVLGGHTVLAPPSQFYLQIRQYF